MELEVLAIFYCNYCCGLGAASACVLMCLEADFWVLSFVPPRIMFLRQSVSLNLELLLEVENFIQ